MLWRALVLLLLVGLSPVQAQSGDPSQNGKEGQTAQQPAATDQRGTDQSPLIVKIAPAGDAKAKADQEAEERASKDKFDRYTLILAIVGVSVAFLQFIAIGVQAYFLWLAFGVAKVAADASDLSAQAAIGLQLPRLVVRAMSMYMAGQPYGQWKPFENQLIGGAAPPDTFQVGIEIANVGKTNADMTQHCIAQYIGPRLPKIPEYKAIISAPVGEIIRADDGYVRIHVQNQFFHIDAGERHAMGTVELSHHLWIYGFVRFTDFMGKPHEQRFCKRWSKGGPLGAPGGFVSEGDTPEEYTKSY